MKSPEMSRLLLIFSLAAIALFTTRSGATTYYLSPSGVDANSGLDVASPWLTPSHTLNCGDVIIAAASDDYSNTSFTKTFGFVSCGDNNNVAWLKCATFDGCKITVPPGQTQSWGMLVNQPYWGVQGWEVQNLTNNGDTTRDCFTTTAHHTVFMNNIANQCGGAGLSCGADYCAIIGNIAYGAAQFNTNCTSAIGSFQPSVYDNLTGTHLYFAGNFVWGATNPNPYPKGCYDGNGFNSDHIADADCKSHFTGAILFENNIAISNGGAGFRVEYASLDGTNCHPTDTRWPIQIVRNNTSWGNGGPHENDYAKYSQNGGQLVIQQASNVTFTQNIGVATDQYLYNDRDPEKDGTYAYNSPFQCADCDDTDSVTGNWLYSTFNVPPLITDSSGVPTSNSTFAYGSNTIGIDPQFRNAIPPGAPNCGGSGFPSTVACMTTLITGFTPMAQASGYGYQLPSSSPLYTQEFPEWLCHVSGMPTGIITSGCRADSPVLGGIM